MPESKLIEAPSFTLDEANKVVNSNTGEPAEGIVVFGPQPTALPEESPITTMERWSEFRQHSTKNP